MKARWKSPTMLSVLWSMIFLRWQSFTWKGVVIRFVGTAVLVALMLDLAVERGDSNRFWWFVVNFYLLAFLPVHCLTKGGEPFRGELKSGTMEYLWTRPVRRWKLFVGLFGGSMLSIVLTHLACLAGILIGALMTSSLPSAEQFLALTICLAASCFSFSAISSVLSALTSKFVVLGISYYFVVDLGLSSLPTVVSQVSLITHVENMMGFETDTVMTTLSGGFWGSALNVAAIGLLALTTSTLLFSRRAYPIGAEKNG